MTTKVQIDSDATLIERSWPDPEIFAALYDRHAPAIHRYIARRLGPDLADEASMERAGSPAKPGGVYS